jgi:prepilin-type processing-associated H-X9-DG protein
MVRCIRRHGFTMSQFLVVLAMLGILIGLFFPAIVKVREAAARAQCQNNIKQIVLAMHDVASTYNGKLPPLAGTFPAADNQGTYFFYILPFIEQDNLYKNAADKAGIYSVWNGSTYSQAIRTYLCPADKTGTPDHLHAGWLATSNYAVNFLVFGDPNSYSLQGSARMPASFPDGTSNTFAVAERLQMCNGEPHSWAYDGVSSWTPAFAFTSTGKPQVRPEPKQCDPSVPQTPHEGGINMGMADGSARTVSPKISAQTWWAACTPAGGEILGSDF